MTNILFLEDLSPGQRFRSPERVLPADDAARFGSTSSHASPMHVAGMTMRLLVESDFRPAGGILGAGVERLHWPNPAQPGALLHVESEVLDIRRSKSRPDRGLARMLNTTLNGANQPVQIMTATIVIPARDQ